MAKLEAPVSRESLRALLYRWRSGAIKERVVYEEAEELYERYGGAASAFDHSDARSIAFEVVSQLEVLDVQLITRADIPAFIEFLETPSGSEGAGWTRWQQYWDDVDFAKRLVELVNNPYYAKRALRSDSRKKR